MVERSMLTDERQFTTIEVSKKALEGFRMAVAKKYRGRIHGMMFIEYSEALQNWARVLNGEAEVIPLSKKTRTPIFDGPKSEEAIQ